MMKHLSLFVGYAFKTSVGPPTNSWHNPAYRAPDAPGYRFIEKPGGGRGDTWGYGNTSYWEREEDGKEELLRIFLELDIDYFENLSKSIDITSNTAEYIAKTAKEIREARAREKDNTKKEAIGPHTRRYLAKQRNTSIEPNI